MQYTKYGNTDAVVSKLGFGCMRLPVKERGSSVPDEEKTVAMLKKAIDLGVNYFDSAYFYHGGESERMLGLAIKGVRDKVYIATKSPGGHNKEPGDYRRLLEQQLERLGVSYIDFYHFHGISYDGFFEVDKRSGWLSAAQKAKDEGVIKHISFSFHGKPEDMAKLADTGVFESVLCQYNVLDRANEEGIAYVKSKGLGVAVMGPLGGGLITGLPDELAKQLGVRAAGTAELGLRFVATNPNVDVLLSGMSSEAQLIENVEYVSRIEPLSEEEKAAIIKMADESKRLADLYCTGCNYCSPCPQTVEISNIFEYVNLYKVYGAKEYAKNRYDGIGTGWSSGKKADACNECGQCEEKCPQKIEIRKQLKEAVEIFA